MKVTKYFLCLSLIGLFLLFTHCSGDDSDDTAMSDKSYDKTTTKDDGSDKTSADFTNTNADTIIHDGLIREYILYVPEAYDGSFDIPLMLNFHGNGEVQAGI